MYIPYPTRDGHELTEEAENLYHQWCTDYEDRGCTCFISPPCGHCTHEGNPRNIEESDDFWRPVTPAKTMKEIIEEAMRAADT